MKVEMMHASGNSPEQGKSDDTSPHLPEPSLSLRERESEQQDCDADQEELVQNKRKSNNIHVCCCGKSFAYLSILESHMRSHTGERPFHCNYCDKRFAQKATLQVHERTHTGERPYMCKYCDKKFAQYGTKTVHEKSAHLGIRNYKCPICTKLLSSPSALYTHKKTHGDKEFQCNYCPKTFTLKNYLKLHVKQVHEQNERKHICQFCDKTFAYSGSLQVHTRTHTGERPYKCKYCPKAFASQGNLQSHERTHTGERPFSCNQCGRAFIQKSQLTAHEATHNYIPAAPPPSAIMDGLEECLNGPGKKQNEYACKFCGKRYAYASSLYVHTRLHTGERPFKCRFCHKKFTNQGNMQVHERVHTGERPYKCPSCDKSYAQKVGLKIHLEQCWQYLNAKNVVISNNGSPATTGSESSDACTESAPSETGTINREQKKKRLEKLLPKLFNGRMKPKPTHSTHHKPYTTVPVLMEPGSSGQMNQRKCFINPLVGLKLPTVPAVNNSGPIKNRFGYNVSIAQPPITTPETILSAEQLAIHQHQLDVQQQLLNDQWRKIQLVVPAQQQHSAFAIPPPINQLIIPNYQHNNEMQKFYYQQEHDVTRLHLRHDSEANLSMMLPNELNWHYLQNDMEMTKRQMEITSREEQRLRLQLVEEQNNGNGLLKINSQQLQQEMPVGSSNGLGHVPALHLPPFFTSSANGLNGGFVPPSVKPVEADLPLLSSATTINNGSNPVPV